MLAFFFFVILRQVFNNIMLGSVFMFCEKCGERLNDTETKCPKCGAVVTGDIRQPKMNNASSSAHTQKKSGALEFIAKHRDLLLLLIEVPVIILCIATANISTRSVYWGRDSRGDRIGQIHRNALISAILLAIGLIILIISAVHYLKLKANKNCYCIKCKKKTYHNQFRVCTVCNSDFMAMIVVSAFFYIAVMCGMIYLTVDTYGHRTICILSVIVMILAVLKRIYLYPSILARRTGHTAATAIFILNVILGLMGIMWLVLVIWASTGGNNKNVVMLNPDGTSVTVNNINKTSKQSDSMQGKFEELKKLHDMGMLSDEEFEQKRKEFVSRL